LSASVVAATVLSAGATAVTGLLIPQIATATTDTCGYPTNTTTKTATIFNESTVTRAVQIYGVGTSAKVGVFANDETSLLLGVDGSVTQLGTGYLSSELVTNGTYTSLSLGAGTSGPSGSAGTGLQQQVKQGDSDATCGSSGGTAVIGQSYSRTLTNATSAADTTLATSNSSYSVPSSTSVSRLVTFTSTDPNVKGSSTWEVTSLTVNNG
jgi:hypothetical protein